MGYVRLSAMSDDLNTIPADSGIKQMTDKSLPTQTHMVKQPSIAFASATNVLENGSAPSCPSKSHHLEDASASLNDGLDHRLSLQMSKSRDAFILENQEGDGFEVYSSNSSLDSD